MNEKDKTDLLALKFYFNQHRRQIEKLHNSLGTQLTAFQIKPWVSIMIELFLYAIILFVIYIIMQVLSMPNGYLLEFKEKGIDVETLTTFLIFIRIIFMLMCIPILLMAFIIRTNRKKNESMRDALEVLSELKQTIENTQELNY